MAERDIIVFSPAGGAAPEAGGAGRSRLFRGVALVCLGIGVAAIGFEVSALRETIQPSTEAPSPPAARHEPAVPTEPAAVDSLAVRDVPPPSLATLPTIQDMATAATERRLGTDGRPVPPLPPRRPDRPCCETAERPLTEIRQVAFGRPDRSFALRLGARESESAALTAVPRAAPDDARAVSPALRVSPVLPPLPPRRPQRGGTGVQPDSTAKSASPSIADDAGTDGRLLGEWQSAALPTTSPVGAAAPVRRLNLSLNSTDPTVRQISLLNFVSMRPAEVPGPLPPRVADGLVQRDREIGEELAAAFVEIFRALNDPALAAIGEPQVVLERIGARALERTALDLTERALSAPAALEAALGESTAAFESALAAAGLQRDDPVARALRAAHAQRSDGAFAFGQNVVSRQADYLMAVAELAGALDRHAPAIEAGSERMRYGSQQARAEVVALARTVDEADAALERYVPAVRSLAPDFHNAIPWSSAAGSLQSSAPSNAR